MGVVKFFCGNPVSGYEITEYDTDDYVQAIVENFVYDGSGCETTNPDVYMADDCMFHVMPAFMGSYAELPNGTILPLLYILQVMSGPDFDSVALL